MTTQERYTGAVMNTFGPPKLVLTRGVGTRVYDEDGKEYLDLLGGIAVNSLGHAHPALVEAVTTQMQTLGHVSNFFATEPQVTLAERLLDLANAGRTVAREGRVFFTNSGTEANEAAFKATRKTGRTRIVAAEGAFHGRTMGALALTAKEAYRAPFEPLPGEVTWVPFGDVAALEAAVDETVAAVILEPLQGEAGVNVPADGYLTSAREITRRHGALLWLDEVQTGVGRTGRWLASAKEPGVDPDLVTLAKGLAGGFPIGALLAFGDAATLLGPGNHGTTFGGNPVAAAAALAVLDTIENDGLLDHADRLGKHLRDGLAHPHVTEVRGEGLLIGISLDREAAGDAVVAAQEAGFIVNMCTPDRLRLAPPLVLTDADADEFLAAWPGILATAYGETGHETRHETGQQS